MPESVSISFPHLGIALKNLGNSFSLFGIDIAFYGMIIGCGDSGDGTGLPGCKTVRPERG